MDRRTCLRILAAIPFVGPMLPKPEEAEVECSFAMQSEPSDLGNGERFRVKGLVWAYFGIPPTDENGRSLSPDEIKDRYGFDENVRVDVGPPKEKRVEIEDVRLFARVLTSEEIKQLYKAGP